MIKEKDFISYNSETIHGICDVMLIQPCKMERCGSFHKNKLESRKCSKLPPSPCSVILYDHDLYDLKKSFYLQQP